MPDARALRQQLEDLQAELHRTVAEAEALEAKLAPRRAEVEAQVQAKLAPRMAARDAECARWEAEKAALREMLEHIQEYETLPPPRPRR